MPKDLRSFIAELEAKSPEEIARVNKPLSPRYEISALLTHLEKIKRFPLLFFEKVKGSDAPVVINAQASRRLMWTAGGASVLVAYGVSHCEMGGESREP